MWRSLVAHLFGVQVVAGSNPATRTKEAQMDNPTDFAWLAKMSAAGLVENIKFLPDGSCEVRLVGSLKYVKCQCNKPEDADKSNN